MEHDLKAMYWVRGQLIMAIANATEVNADPEVLKILWKARDIIEAKISKAELPAFIEKHKDVIEKMNLHLQNL